MDLQHGIIFNVNIVIHPIFQKCLFIGNWYIVILQNSSYNDSLGSP